MDEHAMNVLEYGKVKERVKEYAMSHIGKSHIDEMYPLTSSKKVEGWLTETEEALSVIQSGSSVPIPTMEGLDTAMRHAAQGVTLSLVDFEHLLRFLESVGQLIRYLVRKQEISPRMASYALGMSELPELKDEIIRVVPHGQVVDDASPELSRIRRQLSVIAQRMRKKLDGCVQKYQEYLIDKVVLTRGERYVLAVGKSHKRLVPGVVVDESASGQTVYIEPTEISTLAQERDRMQNEEAAEVSKVLSTLTGWVLAEQSALEGTMSLVGWCDFVFAKAKYAKSIGGRRVLLDKNGVIHLRGAKHPLLGQDVVPLDLRMGDTFRALVVTGPNTGGKTVSLKTIGLLSLMAQSGMLIPVQEGSRLPLFTDILADIGDGQSIEQSLSTFSAHIKNLIRILEAVGPGTLVLLDELAAGTDPGEGAGLSIALLEELYRRGATLVATTHFNDIKRFAERAEGFENARMEFDLDTLSPLYRLRVGEAGHSYALFIAQKLGLQKDVIERSRDFIHSESDGKDQPQPRTKFDPTHVKASNDAPDSLRGKVHKYERGDRVWIHSRKCSGIVCEPVDDQGFIELMVQKKRIRINHKRISPYLSKEELYPDAKNYDLDIVLESKEARKKRKIMSKHHVPGLLLEHDSAERPKTMR